LLGSARSDSSGHLVQTQVEFLEFVQQLENDPVDLATLANSMCSTAVSRRLRQATVFETLRDDATARGHLDRLIVFWIGPIIDADEIFLGQIPQYQPQLKTADCSRLEQFRAGAFLHNPLTTNAAVAHDDSAGDRKCSSYCGAAHGCFVLNRLNARIYRRERKTNRRQRA
jgi:hypothetical protein